MAPLPSILIAISLVLSIIYLLLRHHLDFVSILRRDVEASKSAAHFQPPNPRVPLPSSGSVLHIYEEAAVCSDSYKCSHIGSGIMQRGGSAVDAAIATLLCNGLVAMQSMGLGGGMLMNVYIHSKQHAFSILAREVAPLAASANMYAGVHNLSELFQSSSAIGVPAEVMGYAVAHERFGQLPWAELVQPTVDICHGGFALSKHQRDALLANQQMIRRDRHLSRMFVDPQTDAFYRLGTHVRPSEELCHTYEQLAANGPRSFYTGPLASSIAEDLKAMGSFIGVDDFSALKVDIVPSVVFPLGPYYLHVTPPPGSGYVVGFVMNILKQFAPDIGWQRMDDVAVHRITEALKFGFAARWQLDMQQDKELLTNMSCLEYAQKLANAISDYETFADPCSYGADSSLVSRSEHGTAHISVVAPNGDAVAVTSSINFYFGSGRTGSRTGILFNNAMADFAIDGLANYFQLPNVPHKNRIEPSRSPMSSMSPLVVTDRRGRVRLALGAAGGSKIISVLVQLLVRVLWMGEDIKQAIDAPRFHHQLLPDAFEYEYGLLADVIDALQARGHRTQRYSERGTAVCGVERRDGAIFTNADFRKDGGVAGF